MQGAIDGVEESFRNGIEYSVEEVEAIYAGFALSPSAIPSAAFHLFSIDDDFSGNGVINPDTIIWIVNSGPTTKNSFDEK